MCLSIKRDGERKDEIPDIQVNTLAVYKLFKTQDSALPPQ